MARLYASLVDPPGIDVRPDRLAQIARDGMTCLFVHEDDTGIRGTV